MSKANLLLKNDVGLVLDITESPLGCTVYDLNGNEIGGGGGMSFPSCKLNVINNTGTTSGVVVTFGYLEDTPILQANGLQVTLSSGQEATAYSLYADLGGGYVAGLTFNPSDTITASGAENCTYDSGNKLVIITDPTADSEITLTLSR